MTLAHGTYENSQDLIAINWSSFTMFSKSPDNNWRKYEEWIYDTCQILEILCRTEPKAKN